VLCSAVVCIYQVCVDACWILDTCLDLNGSACAKIQELCEVLANYLSANLMQMEFQKFKVLNI